MYEMNPPNSNRTPPTNSCQRYPYVCFPKNRPTTPSNKSNLLKNQTCFCFLVLSPSVDMLSFHTLQHRIFSSRKLVYTVVMTYTAGIASPVVIASIFVHPSSCVNPDIVHRTAQKQYRVTLDLVVKTFVKL